MMLLRDLIRQGIETVSRCYSEREAKEIVSAYMEDVFGIRRYQLALTPQMEMSDMQSFRARSDFERMAAGEPLQYVTGKAYFYGREFRVTPDVLIPRQETELLCQSLICQMIPKTPAFTARCKGPQDHLPSRSRPLAGGGTSSPSFWQINDRRTNVLDLCTGSGCIAWTLALEMPGAAVTAVDISDGALEVACSQDFVEEMDRTSAVRPQFVKADVLQGPHGAMEGQKFDIIVSNPPYVMDSEKAQMRANVLEHEPHLALFVPDEDPLIFYRAVAGWAIELLSDDGVGMVEINEALGKETAELFLQAGFTNVEIVKDLHEKDRFVKFRGRNFIKK